eukprot:4026888-Alexandrium_andersonii.AAC.1
MKGKSTPGRVYRPDGALTADRGETLDVLWQSRREVWGTGWAENEASRALLQAYGRRRTDRLSAAWPRRGQLQAAILRAGGSAPGADGVPYKLFHYGA